MGEAKANAVRRKLQILIVDDAQIMRKVLAHWLDQIVYCRTIEARDGIEAMEILAKSYENKGKRFDLVVTDLVMPGAEGWTLLDFIRNTKKDKSLPVVVLTTRGEDDNLAKARQMGANAFLTKPLNYQDLMRCLLELFGKKQAAE